MIIIRPARPEEIPALTVIADDDERNSATAEYLTGLLDSGCTRPDWCLVAEAGDGRLVGNIVLWTTPGREVPMDIVLFEAGDAVTGALLLQEAGLLARSLGAQTQGHAWDWPAQAPQFQRDAQLRSELLGDGGFALSRDGCRFRWTSGSPVPPADPRLTWRSLAELGEAPFVDLLQDVLAETADSLLLAEVDKHGLRVAAQNHFRECLGYDHQPQWYEIGYDADGSPAALSLPARNAAFAIISMVGVAKAHRGKGYATAVVARGTHLLVEAGATEIRGDCDAANIAMFRGFQRCGYDNFVNRRIYSRGL